MKTSRTYAPIDIVELNNAAILRMRQRDHAAAAALLHEALENFKDIYERNSPDEEECESSSFYQNPRKRPRTSLEEQKEYKEIKAASDHKADQASKIGILCSVRIQESDISEQSSIPSDNILTFYDRTFIFLNHRDVDFQSAVNKSSLSAMLLYNLAVSHHSQGIRQGNTHELAMALRFYRLSHCVLEKVKDVVNLEIHLLILMALLNNMGHIHASYYNVDQTSRCIEWLQRAITSKHSGILEDVDYEFFYIHLKVIPVEHLKFAPAA